VDIGRGCFARGVFRRFFLFLEQGIGRENAIKKEPAKRKKQRASDFARQIFKQQPRILLRIMFHLLYRTICYDL
jgi:hypothetical protein